MGAGCCPRLQSQRTQRTQPRNDTFSPAWNPGSKLSGGFVIRIGERHHDLAGVEPVTSIFREGSDPFNVSCGAAIDRRISCDMPGGRHYSISGSDPSVCGSHGERDAPPLAWSKVIKRQPMEHPTSDYPIVAFGEALRGLTGAGIAMFVVCAIGGAVPTVAGWRYLPGTEDWVFLTVAWVWHWAIAGLMFWGLLALLVPVWSFHELLHGNGSPFLALAVALITQLVVSTVAVCIVEYEYERMRPIAASGGIILVVISVVLRVSRSTTRSSYSGTRQRR
jgi:hypothetical protein